MEINERVEKIAKRLAIESILDKFPSECSGGQRQRAASARALITEPKLIIADEPTGNLDSKNSHELLKILKELNEEEGITIIMVTHDSLIASYAKSLIFKKYINRVILNHSIFYLFL
ncbi:ATP-binding cassette domain-containing protein [uncultured Clostridium sp.]|uniref:ATP-binding cassette domain-containing protein n=1 Tax=uncultured Clostridium sp. TaxID=59620 RepID=UPI0034A0BD54